MPSKPSTSRLPHVKAVRQGAREWLYYRRGGRQWPLPGPEGSAAFLLAYEKVHAAYDTLRRAATPRIGAGTVDAAVVEYLTGADFQTLSPATQREYRRVLGKFREAFGALPLIALDAPWWEALRAKHVSAPIAWNNLRSRMREVIRLYRRLHRGELPENPLDEVRRLPVGESDQNRPWPPSVLTAVLRAATPEFRALVIAYLLTAQRGGDVTQLHPEQYDPVARTLAVRQEKTGTPVLLHVPDTLAATLDGMAGRHKERLLVTPRGKAWTLANAQETLARLLRELELPRYTLHGLRATGPSALKLRGAENRALRTLTGHTNDRTLEIYLRGVANYPLARQMGEMLEDGFGALIAKAGEDANQRRFVGATGRAAAKRRALESRLESGKSGGRPARRKPEKV